jgi:hypothetical protein
MASAESISISVSDCILEDNKRLRADLMRCLRFIKTIHDNSKRANDNSDKSAWTRELWAIKREIHA